MIGVSGRPNFATLGMTFCFFKKEIEEVFERIVNALSLDEP